MKRRIGKYGIENRKVKDGKKESMGRKTRKYGMEKRKVWDGKQKIRKVQDNR